MPLKPHQQELLDALRSGNYIQNREALRINDTYCCLGVACDIAVKHGIIPGPTVSYYSSAGYQYYEYGVIGKNDAVLPQDVMEWFGFIDRSGGDGTANTKPLTVLNNTWNFKQIADFIEANPNLVFKDTE